MLDLDFSFKQNPSGHAADVIEKEINSHTLFALNLTLLIYVNIRITD